jgi:hypothetical protein
MSGSGQEWYPLINLPTDQAIWMADMNHPDNVTLITMPEGFLIDKVRGRGLLNPDEPIQGWMLCQIPTAFIPAGRTPDLRLRVNDTATDEAIEKEGGTPSRAGNILNSEWQWQGLDGINIKNFEIRPYGQ